MYIVSSLFKYRKVPYDDERGCSARTLHFLCRNSGRPSQNPGNFGHSNSINSEIGNMSQKEDVTLEYFVERLQYNLQRSGHPNVSKDILKTIFLKVVREDCLDMLNMLGKGDISKETYEDIVDLFKICSRGSTRNKSATKDTTFSRVQKSANGGATREEIGNMLENFKTEMINSFSSQMDTL
jgi:hypothetical protein